MKKIFILIIFVMSSILFYGCSGSEAFAERKREVNEYSEKTIKAEIPAQFYLECENCNVEIYTWHKKEAKFEMHKVIWGKQQKEELEKKLKNLWIDIRQEGSGIYFNSSYKGTFDKKLEKSVDIKIYMPRRTDNVSLKIKNGRVRIVDDLKCRFAVEMDMGDVEVNRLEGLANLSLKKGNIRFSNGELSKESSIKTKTGNIIVKTQVEENGSYIFETEEGNIDLFFPEDTKLSIENHGTVTVNEFTDTGKTKIITKSGMGQIRIKKY